MKGFSHYKQQLDTILEYSFINKKEFKNNLSIIMGAMKYSPSLREFFTLYNEIETKKYNTKEDCITYINESIEILKGRKKELKKVIPIVEKIINKRKITKNIEPNKVYESIDKLIFNKNINNLDLVVESKNELIDNMVTILEKSPNKPINPKILSLVLSKTYNKEYNESLKESEKNILKNTLLMTEDNLTNEFKNVKEIALTKINKLLIESNDESLSAKLVETKNRIKTFEPSKKTYIRVRGLLEDLN